MSGRIGKSHGLSSPLKVEEEAYKVMEKQGIVSILGSEQTKSASLRRTLSADMSKKWLAQNGLISSMKKISSSQELAISISESSSSSEEEDDESHERNEVWRSIQAQKKEVEKTGQLGVWGSILSQKANEDSSKVPPPYVHPLVKRSSSSLSEKSLQICTESLGSETGSDGFSSYAPSETGDVEEDKEAQQPQQENEWPSFVKYNYSTIEKFQPRSFPPPLPSLARRDGPSLQMQSHRENGRLVLESVSVPSQNCFRAQRQDGRLLLTLANTPLEEPTRPEEMIDQEEDEVGEMEEDVFENFEEDKDSDASEAEEQEEQEEEEEVVDKFENEVGAKEIGIVMDQAPKLARGVINVHRSALMIKKLMGIDNRNPTRANKFNKAVNFMEVEEGGTTPLAQSLPRPPSMARLIPSPPAAASFNAYEYFWRAKTTVINPITKQGPPPLKNNCNKVVLSNSPKAYEQKDRFPLLRGCSKDPRRSLLIWEPYCIASS
ncbi:protein FAF-like, chloroplastic [Actinidia eriantha]|uniref:protein FAF-like, chloroplastic n=1 Tax=Actinidia eriantha TaxID=165200 RepID=UPI00258399C7|nr:protein FAF-like, chloroplastic [Actinidia eriantha]